MLEAAFVSIVAYGVYLRSTMSIYGYFMGVGDGPIVLVCRRYVSYELVISVCTEWFYD